MTVQRPRASRIVPAFVVLASLSASARGQSISVDPYDPWNAMYRPFTYPTTTLNRMRQNEGRVDLPVGGSFGLYLDPVGSSDPFGRLGRPGGRFTPYYQSYRQLSSGDRTYMPNRNDSFYEDQQKRQQALSDAQTIRDPKRRAAEIRRLRREGAEAARTGDAVRGGRRPATPAPAAPAANPAPAAQPAAPAAGTPRRRGLLDDDPLTRELLAPTSTVRGRALERRQPVPADGGATTPP
jgi:hypothetical protein